MRHNCTCSRPGGHLLNEEVGKLSNITASYPKSPLNLQWQSYTIKNWKTNDFEKNDNSCETILLVDQINHDVQSFIILSLGLKKFSNFLNKERDIFLIIFYSVSIEYFLLFNFLNIPNRKRLRFLSCKRSANLTFYNICIRAFFKPSLNWLQFTEYHLQLKF